MRPTQVPVTALTAYAAWLAYKCPCRKMLSCHLAEYFAALGVATALVLWENGMLRA